MYAVNRALRFLAVVMPFACAHPAAAAEETTVSAMSAWQGQGVIYQVGERQALFVGTFGGVMFVEDGRGVLQAAQIDCPGMLEIDLENGKQLGEGRCIITGPDGDSVFAKWECAGVHLSGCAGQFTLTAGSGKFQGITGGGEIIARSAIARLAADAAGTKVDEVAAGVAQWPRLSYRVP